MEHNGFTGKRGFRYWLTLGASILLGLVFVSSGAGKLFGQSAFLLNVQRISFFPSVVATIVGYWLPWVELVIGLFLLAGIITPLAALVSTALSAAFIFHNSWMIAQGFGYEPCGCLGAFEKLFQGELSTTGSLYVDISMLILAVGIYFGYNGKFFNVFPWYLRKQQINNDSLPEMETEALDSSES